MALIDSHAHLTYPEFRDRIGDVLVKCDQSGVERVITIGTSLEDARNAVALARAHPKRIHAAAGFHPHEADSVTDEQIAAMTRLWDDPLIVAFGEMGLDYHYNFADRAKQRHVFKSQLEAARDHNKPIIIHARESIDDVIPMLVDEGFANRRVVFHCFTGTDDDAAKIAAHGWRISFTGIVTFPKSGDLQNIARGYPTEKIMVETDSPYLSPVPVRSAKPCEPAYVAHTARFLSQLREVAYDDFVDQTRRNAVQFFGLPE